MKRLALILLLLCSLAPAQTSPFLPEDTYQKLVNEISGDNAYDHLRDLTKFHSPQGVDRDARRIEQYLLEKVKETGLADVKYITMPSKDVPWSPISGEAWLIETLPDGKVREIKLGSYKEVATVIADNSRPVDTQAELVDVGTGLTEAEYAGKDVRGKIVLASGAPATVEKLAVWKHGALGILSHTTSRVFAMDYPDQIAWARVNGKADPETKKEPGWAFVISPRRGHEIAQKLKGAGLQGPGMGGVVSTATAARFKVRVKIESEILPQSTQAIVEGWIRGKSIHNQQVVLTAHIQEERFSANDDRSGCANLLEMARAYNAYQARQVAAAGARYPLLVGK